MRIGFTGSQDGMTEEQGRTLFDLLFDLFVGGSEFNHGNCIGADEQAASLAQTIGYITVSFPGDIADKQSDFVSDRIAQPPKYPLKRNPDIVNASPHGMFATPDGYKEELRSGTWSTVRYVLGQHVPLTIIWPNGTRTEAFRGRQYTVGLDGVYVPGLLGEGWRK